MHRPSGPFKNEKQRAFMKERQPERAARWEEKEARGLKILEKRAEAKIKAEAVAKKPKESREAKKKAARKAKEQ